MEPIDPQKTEEFKPTSMSVIQTPIEVPIIPVRGIRRKTILYLFINRNFFLDEKDISALQNIFNDTVYYLIKSGNEENVSLAKAKVRYQV